MRSFRSLRSLAVVAVAALVLVPALALTETAAAQARGWRVASGSRIQFVSDAPLERITGTSSTVAGELTIDPTDLSSARGFVTVSVASLETANDLRDEHLHGDGWLDAAAHPEARFEITSVTGAAALTPGEVVRVTLHGNFTIHGHTNAITATAQVRWLVASDELRADGITGDLIRAQAQFSIELPDYGVSVNPLVRLKVSDHIVVNVTLRATST